MTAADQFAAFGPPLLHARMRVTAEDFRVEELPGFEPSGAGEHLLLTIEKRGMTTAFAARRIAAWAGVTEMAIGYAGMKDRHAVTRQRISVHLPKRIAPEIAALESDDLHVLSSDWHARKLPRGALAGNRFELTLRDAHGDVAALDARLQEITRRGFPNAFGEQRFGRFGDNVENARRMFAGQRVKREQRSLLLSAARSELFNAALAARIADGRWDSGVDGEVWMLDGSHSVFGPEPSSAELAERVARLDVHPTGPMWGRGELRSTGTAHLLEAAALLPFADLQAGLEAAGLKQERRALRAPARGLAWRWSDPQTMVLSFALAPGSYATALLAQLGAVDDAYRSSEGR